MQWRRSFGRHAELLDAWALLLLLLLCWRGVCCKLLWVSVARLCWLLAEAVCKPFSVCCCCYFYFQQLHYMPYICCCYCRVRKIYFYWFNAFQLLLPLCSHLKPASPPSPPPPPSQTPSWLRSRVNIINSNKFRTKSIGRSALVIHVNAFVTNRHATHAYTSTYLYTTTE